MITFLRYICTVFQGLSIFAVNFLILFPHHAAERYAKVVILHTSAPNTIDSGAFIVYEWWENCYLILNVVVVT